MSIETAIADSQRTKSPSKGTITAEIRLEHDRLVLVPTLERTSAITVELEYETTLESGETLCFLTASGDDFETFERELAADPTVTDPLVIDCYSDRRIYRVTLTDHAISVTPATAAVGGRIRHTESHIGGWTLELRLPDRDALVQLNEHCQDEGIGFAVNHLRIATGNEDGLVGLTDKQQHLLTVAYEEGYFEVPREISQTELAAELDVSKSAISQRLRRAIAELCASTL